MSNRISVSMISYWKHLSAVAIHTGYLISSCDFDISQTGDQQIFQSYIVSKFDKLPNLTKDAYTSTCAFGQ